MHKNQHNKGGSTLQTKKKNEPTPIVDDDWDAEDDSSQQNP